MRNYSKMIGALAAASAFAAGNASAFDFEGSIHTGYTNEYIFRGINLGQDLVEVGADVSTEWNGLSLSAGAWYASFDTQPGDVNFDELDLYGGIAKDFDFVTAEVGYIFYHFFNDADDAQEVYFSLSRDFGFLEASLTYYWDIESDNEGYAELGLGKSFELSDCLTANVGAALGYATEAGHLSHLTTTVSLDYAVTDTATLSPFVALAVDLSGGHFDTKPITTSTAPATKNELVGGVKFAVGF